MYNARTSTYKLIKRLSEIYVIFKVLIYFISPFFQYVFFKCGCHGDHNIKGIFWERKIVVLTLNQ